MNIERYRNIVTAVAVAVTVVIAVVAVTGVWSWDVGDYLHDIQFPRDVPDCMLSAEELAEKRAELG